MNDNDAAFHKVSWPDSIIAALLISASCFRAGMADGGGTLSILHALTLASVFLLVSTLLQRANEYLARAWFSLVSLLIVIEVVIQAFTGLHINWFVVSLLLQPGSSSQIGLPLPLMILAAIITFAVFWALSATLKQYTFRFRPMVFAATTVALFTSTQLFYAVAYFDGAAQILQARRMLPMFWAPHPYRSNKLLGVVLGPRGVNPFSASRVQKPLSAFDGFNTTPSEIDLSQAPNILFVITDSLRSKDIAEDRSIAPNLFRAADKGHLQLDHYSVSNCTHFSMFTLLTGELAIGYGPARRSKYPLGLFPALARAGYNVSTSESGSLDWYDLSEILLPAETERWIASGTDALENDAEATSNTLQVINSWLSRDKPSFHLTFLEGTHYPYSDTLETPGSTNLEKYKSAVTLFDNQLERILSTLNSLPESRPTLVIISSDHGEEFQNEGIVGHASRLSEEQTKVPMVVLGANTNTTALRSHADIPDFVLGEVGLPQSSAPENPVILANCDYDYPSGFTIFQDDERFDFAFDDGYLVPTVETIEQHDATTVVAAARNLLNVINKPPVN